MVSRRFGFSWDIWWSDSDDAPLDLRGFAKQGQEAASWVRIGWPVAYVERRMTHDAPVLPPGFFAIKPDYMIPGSLTSELGRYRATPWAGVGFLLLVGMTWVALSVVRWVGIALAKLLRVVARGRDLVAN